MMKRILLIAAAACALTACGGSRRASPSYVIDYRPQVPRSSVTPLATARERRAGRAAEKLLRRLALPPGAVRLPAPAPEDRLAQSGLGVSVVSMTADRFSLWRVPGSGAAAMTFEERHMPAGLHGDGGGSSLGGYGSEEFAGRALNGSPQRAVSVSVEPSGGGTVLRLDAGVAWIYPRSASEELPNGIRKIDILGGGVAKHVTAAAKVARIVRWFDELNVYQPGPSVSCPAVLDSHVTFSFRSASGAPLASADVPSAPASNCNSIVFSSGGKARTSLIDARWGRFAFANRVERLLGVRFSEPRP
jgi:hypothetical protein